MKKHSALSISIGISIVLALAGCASKPANPAAAAKSSGKVAKQRTVLTKVPVLVKQTTYYSDGLVDEFTVYKLDDAKQSVVERDKYDASRSEPIERAVLELKDGRLMAETDYDADGKLHSRHEMGYDASGRVATERFLDAQGKALSGSAYSYDSSGRKTEWRATDGAGAAKAVTTYAYGKDGILQVDMKNSGGEATGNIKLEYAKGKIAKRSYFGADGALLKYEAYSYTGPLLTSMEYHGPDGSLVSRTSYEYGSLGELVKSTDYSSAGSVSGYSTYEYTVREDSSIETYFE